MLCVIGCCKSIAQRISVFHNLIEISTNVGNKNKQQKRTRYIIYIALMNTVGTFGDHKSTMVKTAKYENLRLPAHSNGIPTTCTLEMEFFSQLRNNPEVTGLPVCHVMQRNLDSRNSTSTRLLARRARGEFAVVCLSFLRK